MYVVDGMSMGNRAVKNLLIDGTIKLIILFFMVGRFIAPSNEAALSNKQPCPAPDLSQHHNQ